MPMTLEAYARLRPYLYHITATDNLAHLRGEPRLVSAASLLAASGNASLIREKRRAMLSVTVGDRTFVLRDQKPLHKKFVDLKGGWTFADFLEALNHRVYFWPGDALGPKGGGPGHLEIYARPEQIHPSTILRIPLASLLAANPNRTPHFSRYNFGSPRITNGRPSPRGPHTCLPLPEYAKTPSTVVEVTFLDEVALPPVIDARPLTPATLAEGRPVGQWARL